MKTHKLEMKALTDAGAKISQTVLISEEPSFFTEQNIHIRIPVVRTVKCFPREYIAVDVFLEIDGDGDISMTCYKRNSLKAEWQKHNGADRLVVIDDEGKNESIKDASCIGDSETEGPIVLWNQGMADVVDENTTVCDSRKKEI